MATMEWWDAMTSSGAKFQYAVVSGIFLDDLHALSCYFDPPIFFLGVGEELAEFGEPRLGGLEVCYVQTDVTGLSQVEIDFHCLRWLSWQDLGVVRK